ncbi:hypothetical protein R6Q59_006481 [Mikania micrantha]|uniref:O-methyltransferase domain-containing protein n=1 Tax=Mikania micrantha TaxID=192012 RepID=A0A5N6PTD3_9ASTR|nr:hypothetical protein E3N88_04077 [Mikania micrantha]
MAMQNEDQSEILLESQTHIWNHIYTFIKSMSLKCAIQLQIPDIIDHHGSPMLLSELVEALPINQERAQSVYRLMRILVHCGFFVKQSVSTTGGNVKEEEGYMLAPASRLLLKENPLSLRPYLLCMFNPIMMDPWQDLSKWFQNDDVTPFHMTHGRSLYDLADQELNLNQFFNEAMACDAKLCMGVVLEKRTDIFQGLDSVVDVGGGTGEVAKVIAKAFPNTKCICFDLPHVVNGLVESNNLTYVGGDMFEAIPKAHTILLKWILHNWNDEECKKILTNCKEAIPSKEHGGKLVIIDIVLKVDQDDNKIFETQLFFDMVMMIYLTGRQRTEKDWAKLFFDSGFSDYKVTPILGLRSLIEVYP